MIDVTRAIDGAPQLANFRGIHSLKRYGDIFSIVPVSAGVALDTEALSP